METIRGILHILRTFYGTDNTGVYDVAFTRDDVSGIALPPNPDQRIRRFSSEQELTEFLKKRLHRGAAEVERVLQSLRDEQRARISVDLPEDELRRLDLAA